MSYLNHDQILDIITQGELELVDLSCLNAASLDVRLGDRVMMEVCTERSQVIALVKELP